jgi:membrane protein implicated in regulation of membrane protease activity
MTLELAHASHWAVQVAYFLPVAAFLAWLGWNTLKERRGAKGAGE